MQEENESRLANSNIDIDSDVLVAGHHGSRTSSTSAFLSAVSPEVVIISSGANNTYGHPHQEALDRIGESGTKYVLKTDVDGSIVITTTGTGDYHIDTSASGKTMVIPEFPETILMISIGLATAVILVGGARAWKSLRQV